jgi:hypothetical protein
LRLEENTRVILIWGNHIFRPAVARALAPRDPGFQGAIAIGIPSYSWLSEKTLRVHSSFLNFLLVFFTVLKKVLELG